MSYPDELIPAFVISDEQARPIMESFRTNILANSETCVITGKGKAWFPGGTVGTGIEAAHIVPQTQWNTYPIHGDTSIASNDEPDELSDAWLCTWA